MVAQGRSPGLGERSAGEWKWKEAGSEPPASREETPRKGCKYGLPGSRDAAIASDAIAGELEFTAPSTATPDRHSQYWADTFRQPLKAEHI